MRTREFLTVQQQTRIAEGIYDLRLAYPEGTAPSGVRPGQFVGVYTNDPAKLLPRPISICGWDEENGILRLVYRVAGAGTRELAALQAGERAAVLGILGNGYDPEALAGRRVLLIGGGIGAPPLLGLAKALSARKETDPAAGEGQVVAALGYRTNDLFLAEEFRSCCSEVLVATDDGSAGVHGNAVMAAEKEADECDVICACGPLPMLRAVKKMAEEKGRLCYLSLEERMACGVGACLGCVVKTTHMDAHSHVRNARVCTEGPVFRADEIDI